MKRLAALLIVAGFLGSCTQPLCGCMPATRFGAGRWRGAVAWPSEIVAPESLIFQLTQSDDRVSGSGAAYYGAPARPVLVAGRTSLYSRYFDLGMAGWYDGPSRFVGTVTTNQDTLIGVLESPRGDHVPLPLRLERVRD